MSCNATGLTSDCDLRDLVQLSWCGTDHCDGIGVGIDVDDELTIVSDRNRARLCRIRRALRRRRPENGSRREYARQGDSAGADQSEKDRPYKARGAHEIACPNGAKPVTQTQHKLPPVIAILRPGLNFG